MAIREDSYGSVAGVRALTRHLLDGAATFSDQTRPTLADVEGFIDRWSAMLNLALINREVVVPVENETIRLVCEQWVIRQAAAEVELTQRGTGFSDNEDSRANALRPVGVDSIADAVAEGLRILGTDRRPPLHEGLTFTGLPSRVNRPDRHHDGYEQPIFTRGQFDL